MKVLLLTNHLNIGGVSSYTVNLAIGLREKGFSVFVASSGGDLLKKLEGHGIPHLKINLKTKFEFNPKLIFAFARLLLFITKNNIDIIHAQTRITQVIAYLIAKVSHASYVSTCHGFFRYSRIGRRIFGAWGDNVIAISDVIKDHMIKDFKIKKENVSLIYNGVNSESFADTVAEEEKGALKRNIGFSKSPVIGSISRLSPVKGLRYLFFAMKEIMHEMPETRLLLVGEGPSKENLMELARQLGIMDSVFFALSTTETRRFLSIIDIFVFYSLEEGLGLSLLEAMAAGKPCVASSVGGVSSIIKDGETGLLVPPKDTHELKNAIMRLLRDRKLAKSLSEKAKALVEEKFSLSKMIDKVVTVYERAVDPKKREAHG